MAAKFNGVIEGACAQASAICHHYPSGVYLLFLKFVLLLKSRVFKLLIVILR